MLWYSVLRVGYFITTIAGYWQERQQVVKIRMPNIEAANRLGAIENFYAFLEKEQSPGLWNPLVNNAAMQQYGLSVCLLFSYKAGKHVSAALKIVFLTQVRCRLCHIFDTNMRSALACREDAVIFSNKPSRKIRSGVYGGKISLYGASP